MKTKYVCLGLIGLYVYFDNNWTRWSTTLHVKICRWGEKEKEPQQHYTYQVKKRACSCPDLFDLCVFSK